MYLQKNFNRNNDKLERYLQLSNGRISLMYKEPLQLNKKKTKQKKDIKVIYEKEI